jgi:ribonuclease P protein component
VSDQTLPASQRVRRRTDFEHIYAHGLKRHGRFMTMFVLARESAGADLPPGSRLGVAATRKLGGAVIRNRAKRVARELFRRHKPAAALDVVVVPRREFLTADFPSLEQDYVVLLSARGGSPAGPSRGPRRGPRRGSGAR